MRTKILQLIFVFAVAAITSSSAQTLTPFYENGKSGYKDVATGRVVITPRYRSASTMIPYGKEGNYYAVVAFEGKFGYINEKGEVLIPFMYEWANIFTEGIAAVKLDGKYGFINMKNETVIPFQYDFAGKASSNMARVQKGNTWTFINLSTKTELPLHFYGANDFSEGLASVLNENGQWGFINPQGSYVIAPKYIKAEEFHNGQAMVHDGNSFIHINTSGQVIGSER